MYTIMSHLARPEAAILDWYDHVLINRCMPTHAKFRGCGSMLSQENVLNLGALKLLRGAKSYLSATSETIEMVVSRKHLFQLLTQKYNVSTWKSWSGLVGMQQWISLPPFLTLVLWPNAVSCIWKTEKASCPLGMTLDTWRHKNVQRKFRHTLDISSYDKMQDLGKATHMQDRIQEMSFFFFKNRYSHGHTSATGPSWWVAFWSAFIDA